MATAGEAAHSEHEHHGPKWLAHHFDTPVQQYDAAKIGMWAFLAQELLFFSGLFVAYGVFRLWYPEVFSMGSHLLDKNMGAANTVVLLFSSLTAALAVRSAQVGDQKKTSLYLIITIVCAFIFLIVKYFEYSHKIHVGLLPGHFWAADPAYIREHLGLAANAPIPERMHVFFGIYFMMTGVHGLHVLIGIGVMFWILRRNMRGDFNKRYYNAVDLTALYWHLVDLIWIYLFPLLYLID